MNPRPLALVLLALSCGGAPEPARVCPHLAGRYRVDAQHTSHTGMCSMFPDFLENGRVVFTEGGELISPLPSLVQCSTVVLLDCHTHVECSAEGVRMAGAVDLSEAGDTWEGTARAEGDFAGCREITYSVKARADY